MVGHGAAGERRIAAVEQKADLTAAQSERPGPQFDGAIEIGSISGVDDHAGTGKCSPGADRHFLSGGRRSSAARDGCIGIGADPHQSTIGTELQVLRRTADDSIRSHRRTGRNVHRVLAGQDDIRAGKSGARGTQGYIGTAHVYGNTIAGFTALTPDQQTSVAP